MTFDLVAYLARVRAVIREHGFAIQYITPGPPFETHVSYTIGLREQLGYEVVLMGLPSDVGQRILNNLAHRLKTSDIGDGENIKRIATTPVRLQTLHPEAARKLNVACAIHGTSDFCVRQLVYTDEQGRFPTDRGYDLDALQSFPIDIDPTKVH